LGGVCKARSCRKLGAKRQGDLCAPPRRHYTRDAGPQCRRCLEEIQQIGGPMSLAGRISPKTSNAMETSLNSYVALAKKFRSGEITPHAYLESCLERIAKFDKTIGAFIVLNIEAARRVADQSTVRWRNGKPLSPIDGMPIGIKDIIETADMPTGQGSPLW